MDSAACCQNAPPSWTCRQGVADSKAQATCWGPQYQGQFLQNLGIAARLEALIEAAPDADQQEALYRGAMRLVTGPRPSSPALDGSASDTTAPGVSSAQSEVEAEEEEQEGLGNQYMAMAITGAQQDAPFPFVPYQAGGGD